MSARQLCTFEVDSMLFGVDVLLVQEVIRRQPMTRAPLAPPAVRGLINLRGQIVTAIDLREHLGLRPAGDERDVMNVVVRGGTETVSLLVDEIGDVLDVNEATFAPTPETVRGEARSMILGVHKLDGRLLHLLDAERTVSLLRAGHEGNSD